MVLRSNQTLTEMSVRSVSWGKDVRCVALKIYHLHVPIILNLGTSIYWKHQGLSRPVTGLRYLYFIQNNRNKSDFHPVWQSLGSDRGCTVTIFILKYVIGKKV